MTVTVNRSDGQSRQFHFIRRLASGGGCIWLKLQQRSVLHCQFAGRDADAMVKNRQRVDDLIDVLVWIRRRMKGSAVKRKRAKTGARPSRERRF